METTRDYRDSTFDLGFGGLGFRTQGSESGGLGLRDQRIWGFRA